MTTSVKQRNILRVLASLLFAAVLLVGSLAAVSTAAKAEGNEATDFYYRELGNSELAQRIYRGFEKMAERGVFDDGKQAFDLIGQGVLKEAEVRGYVDGNLPTVPVAFGAARDAFYMDHPELFYVDVYKIMLSAGQKTDGTYVAYADAGKADNYYVNNTVKNKTEVDAAKTKYTAALDKLVADAKAASDDAVGRIRYVNGELCKVEYDYETRKEFLEGKEQIVNDGYVHSAYGALVNKKAVCDGYSRAFKAAMDKLDIPCVLVQGSRHSSESVDGLSPGYIEHMWNAVELDGHWYAVDTTNNASAIDNAKYLLVGSNTIADDYSENGVISSSGFELKYPVLRSLDYGVNTDGSGFEFLDSGTLGGYEFGYIVSDTDSTRWLLRLGVSYNGKNMYELADEGLYLAIRYIVNGNPTDWVTLYTDNVEDSAVDHYTLVPAGGEAMQFAVIDYPADGEYGIYTNLSAAHIVAISTAYADKTYGNSVPAPWVRKYTPYDTGMRNSFDPLDVKLYYNEPLVDETGNVPNGDFAVDLTVESASERMNDYVKIENLKWHPDESAISFTFTPSKLYQHNCVMYRFYPTNLYGKAGYQALGKDKAKIPEAGGFLSFKMKQVICPKVFNDGRLYLQLFGQPQYVDSTDLSMTDFKDKNGQPVVGNQRSQLMLVVGEPSEADQTELDNALYEQTELEKTDVIKSTTYQIDLQVCGVVQKVPAGSYMQVGFGFPEGFSPTDAGKTVTVYHYKRDPKTGVVTEVEKVPCVVSEYGIIATVQSFSPFTVCVVDADKVTTRNIYASVDGIGGAIDKTSIETVAAGKSKTYTLTAEEGYTLDKVYLNNTEVTPVQVTEGQWTVTVDYDTLGTSNTLTASFIANRAVNQYQGMNIVRTKMVVQPSDIFAAVAPASDAAPKKVNVAAIVLSVILAVVLVAAGAVIAYLVIRLKKNDGNGKGGTTEKKEKAAAKPATQKSTEKTVVTSQPVKPSSQPRPTQPTQTARPAQPSPRPAPTSTSRPTQPSTSRPTQPSTSRPTASAQRPTGTARPAQSRPPQNKK